MSPRPNRLAVLSVCLLALAGSGVSLAADPGRLFYTPAQRAQLEAARARNVTRVETRMPAFSAPPVRFDGVVIRSDGQGTAWVDGRPQTGTAGVPGLKPGQIRADERVYEPYQVLRPAPAPPAAPAVKEPNP
ncbi:MAG: hypothetical protein Q8R61_14240 [Thiobacillus sp.]|uniref:hypothetical protein n=1 Tax=Thiobacillus sp. TaxID=924 RepID=UPI0027353DB6|nr:hypothetical protein [Thiobacillus sp.]MDP3586286.1 hypothetical protein [Thiobacillus sp.]